MAAVGAVLASRMRELEPVDLEWIGRAPQQIKVTARFSVAPDRVFAAFADAASWPSWFPMMTSAVSDGGAAGGLGGVREVALRGLGRFRERFIAWEPGRFAFTVIATSSPILRRLGEDYRLTADGTGTRFDWTMGAELRGVGTVVAPMLRLIMRRVVARAGRNLERRLTSS